MEEPKINQEIIRNEKGQFVEGQSGNPTGEGAGRKKGSVSIVEAFKRKLKKIPKGQPNGQKKTYLDLLVIKYFKKAIKDGDVKILTDLIDRIDGKPKQSTDLTSDGQPIGLIPGLVKLVNDNVRQNDNNKINSEL